MKIKVFAVSDGNGIIQRYYFCKVEDAGFDINDYIVNGVKNTYIDNFSFNNMPKLIEALEERDLIISYEEDGPAITIYDEPLDQSKWCFD